MKSKQPVNGTDNTVCFYIGPRNEAFLFYSVLCPSTHASVPLLYLGMALLASWSPSALPWPANHNYIHRLNHRLSDALNALSWLWFSYRIYNHYVSPRPKGILSEITQELGLVVYLFRPNCNRSFGLWFSQTSLCSYHYTSSLKSWPHNSPQNSCQVCQWYYFLGWGEQGSISLFQEPELLFFYAWGKRLSSH